MRRLRYRLGAWLLRPFLLAQLQHAKAEQAQASEHWRERFWMGHYSGTHDALFAHALQGHDSTGGTDS